MNLILFTDSYPYDYAAEQTFLGEELKALVSCFDRIVVVPRYCKGNRLPILPGVEVDESYSRFLVDKRKMSFFSFLFMREFYLEIASRLQVLSQPEAMMRLLKFLNVANLTYIWLVKKFSFSGDCSSNCMIYTYWFTDITMGAGLIRQKFHRVRVVSRAHGYDIYEEFFSPPYWPCRSWILSKVDALFLASNDGVSYMNTHYPAFVNKFQVAHLGVKDPGYFAKKSEDGVFRIVSCSSVDSNKRVDLLFRGLVRFAEMNPEQKIHWVHFGDGQGMSTLLEISSSANLKNLSWSFPGYVPNKVVMAHYEKEPVDIFATVSASEGGAPVSIQEAISCGIPVLATSVGGIKDIVFDKNGFLLSAMPTVDEVALALFDIAKNIKTLERKKKHSRLIWDDMFSAHKNFKSFSAQLKSLFEN